MGTLKIFSLSNFPTSSAVLTLVTMVYILLWRHLFQNWRFVVYDPLHPYCYLHPCNPYSISVSMSSVFCLFVFRTPNLAAIAAAPWTKLGPTSRVYFTSQRRPHLKQMIIELLKGVPPERDPFCYPTPFLLGKSFCGENASSPHFHFPCILLFVPVELSNHWRRL